MGSCGVGEQSLQSAYVLYLRCSGFEHRQDASFEILNGVEQAVLFSGLNTVSMSCSDFEVLNE